MKCIITGVKNYNHHHLRQVKAPTEDVWKYLGTEEEAFINVWTSLNNFDVSTYKNDKSKLLKYSAKLVVPDEF